MKDKIIVFGATSFIGAYLLSKNKDWKGTISKKLKKYSDSLKNQRVKKFKQKLINFNFFNRKTFNNIKKINVLINCIGFTKNFDNENFNIKKAKKNFNIYLKVLDKIISKYNVKLIIHIGSNHEYGKSHKILNESSVCKPHTKYGIYKLYEFNKIKKKFSQSSKIINLRCFSIFGNLNKTNSLIEQIKEKKNLVIKNPDQKINIISIYYLNNLIKKIIKNYKKLKKVEIINFCSTQPITIRSILNMINLNKKKFSKNILSDNIIGSNNKMKKFINYSDSLNLIKLKNYLN
jgi:nucleoside-diphosphate-sugar epimerase